MSPATAQLVTLLISFVSDFIITAGTGIATAMGATGVVAMPGKAVIVFAVLMGLVAAARRVQALIAPSVIKP